MTVVSGPVTFGSTGPKTIAIGIQAKEIEFHPAYSYTIGHATPSYQFSRTGNNYDTTKISIYNVSGLKVVEFTVTGFGTTTFSCNVTLADNTYPIPLIARS